MLRKDASERLEVFRKKVNLLMKLRGYRSRKEEERTDGMDIAISDREKEKSLIRILTKSRLFFGNIGVHQVRNMEKDLRQTNIEGGILIAKGFSHAAKREARKNGIEPISGKRIPSFNIFDHQLVPKHEALPKEEAEELLERYRIKPYKLPRVKASDPIAVIIGVKPGDILKITRESPTAGNYVTYRYVV